MNQPVSDLSALITSAKPELIVGDVVFICLTDADEANALSPRCVFRESEGITVICTRETAEIQGHSFSSVFRQITLTVHSSLEAVGFLATITAALAAGGIPCNVVSAYHHDHLFVPSNLAEDAIEIVLRLSGTSQETGAT